ncbi:MAG: hypothetical protein HGB03_02185 [Candidatus Yonathbacteria bacterium]|nr:hypothetical protein [Candidatus Yonathbacteria bacterium]NTW47551.1 hypothetical protein [Candidatus Yonathbacteria bacterium]
MHTNAKPLTPLYNTVSASDALLLQSVLIAVSLIPCFFHAILGVAFALFLFLVIGVPYLFVHRSANVFLNTSGEAEAQSEKSWDLFHKLSNNAAWIPFLGLFLFHEQFSSMLRKLRERYESTYWDAMLEHAHKEMKDGMMVDFLKWFTSGVAEEKKGSELNTVLEHISRYYTQIVNQHKDKDVEYINLLEREKKVIRRGNINAIRRFYYRYGESLLSEKDSSSRAEVLSRNEKICALIDSLQKKIDSGESVDAEVCLLGNMTFLRGIKTVSIKPL